MRTATAAPFLASMLPSYPVYYCTDCVYLAGFLLECQAGSGDNSRRSPAFSICHYFLGFISWNRQDNQVSSYALSPYLVEIAYPCFLWKLPLPCPAFPLFEEECSLSQWEKVVGIGLPRKHNLEILRKGQAEIKLQSNLKK